MKNAGIVCEYNPFHNGHKHQIDLLRKSGAECIICVMSGSFTQRGEPAILDKYTRAEIAVRCGADIVLELPFPYCSLSAEGFSRAGAYILDAVGADTLCFGCECGDTNALRGAAEIASSREFQEKYASLQRDGVASTSAYFEAYGQISGKTADFGSNDLLGISYLRAIEELGLSLDALAIKREGSAYNDTELGSSYPSATAVRALIRREDAETEDLQRLMPKEAAERLIGATASNTAPVFEDALFTHLNSFFRLHTPKEIEQRAISLCGGSSILDDGDGIVHRLCTCAKNSTNSRDFYIGAFNSRYTNSRIKRVILYSLLGVSDTYRTVLPEYTTLLAASRRGCEHLSKIRKCAKIKIVTKPADTPECVTSTLNARADSLYTLLMPKTCRSDVFYKCSPFII